MKARRNMTIGCLALAACVGRIGDDAGEPDERAAGTTPGQDAQSWAPPEMRRLTAAQYANSIEDVFGASITVDKALEEDETNELFLSMGAAKVGTSEYGVEQYHAAALDLAQQVVVQAGDYEQLAECQPYEPGDSCIADAIRSFGDRLWRRPMTSEELSRVVAVQAVGDQPGAEQWALGMTYALATLIASPHFIYMPEIGEPDPASGGDRYTSDEMASRLAYVLWNSTPDDALLAAAAAGSLVTAAGVREQAERMLAMPRAADLASRFLGEAWFVGTLESTDKSTDVFAQWSPELLAAQRAEFDLFLRDLTERDGDIFELFTGTTTFVNDELAAFYGLSGGDSTFAQVELPPGRYGLLTSGAVVSAISPSDRTSPTHRGVFILEQLLCTEIPPPPANVDDTFEAPTPEEGLTLKEKLEQHRSDPACSGCHDLMDPLGFTLENFDAIGG